MMDGTSGNPPPVHLGMAFGRDSDGAWDWATIAKCSAVPMNSFDRGSRRPGTTPTNTPPPMPSLEARGREFGNRVPQLQTAFPTPARASPPLELPAPVHEGNSTLTRHPRSGATRSAPFGNGSLANRVLVRAGEDFLSVASHDSEAVVFRRLSADDHRGSRLYCLVAAHTP